MEYRGPRERARGATPGGATDDLDRLGVRQQCAENAAPQRRPARAVRSLQDEALARFDAEREVAQHRLVAEAAREAVDQNRVRSLDEPGR